MNTTAIVTSIDIGIAAAVARTVPYYSSNRNRYVVHVGKEIHLELNWSYPIKSIATSPMMTATVRMDFITISRVACSYHAVKGDEEDVAGTFSSSPLPLPLTPVAGRLPSMAATRDSNSLLSAWS